MTRYLTAALLAGFSGLGLGVSVATEPWYVDVPLLMAMQGLRDAALTPVVRFVTDVGGTLGMLVLAPIALVALAQRSRRAALFFGTAFVSSALVNVMVKLLFSRVRPSIVEALVLDPGGTSFPSGHSQASMSFALALSFALFRTGVVSRWRFLLLLFPLFVGASRLYLGVHYPSDVLGGWFLGATVVLMVDFAFLTREALNNV